MIVARTPGVRLRPAAAGDDGFLRQLFDAVHAQQFAQAGLPDALRDRLLADQFRIQGMSHAAQFPSATSLIVEQQGVPVGRLLLDCQPVRWHVIDIALLPTCRGKGIGTGILEGVARAARDGGAQRLTLTVLEQNLAARRLYARLGFTGTSGGASGGYVALANELAP